MAQKDVIPKTLFMYWHQGWDNAPYMVRRCCETWIKHNPNWNIHMMDAENIEEKIIVPSVAKKLRLPLPALSDVLRICLLQKWGGYGWTLPYGARSLLMTGWNPFVTPRDFSLTINRRPIVLSQVGFW